MSTTTTERQLTAEELLRLPEDGVHRELVRGELRETPMTVRNRRHSWIEAETTFVLRLWLSARPEPRGRIVSGEAGFRLRRSPDTVVGIDVAYVGPEVVAQAPDAPYFEGPPVLAVEILSPSDTQDQVDEKVSLLLEMGVELVWVVNPRFRTVTVYRRDGSIELFDSRAELTAEPHLPGFRVEVARLFGE